MADTFWHSIVTGKLLGVDVDYTFNPDIIPSGQYLFARLIGRFLQKIDVCTPV